MDALQRFIFDNCAVRGEIVRLDDTLQTILAQHHYPQVVEALLAQTITATVLLSATIKYEGKLTVQFQSKGCLKMLVAQCDQYQQVRATAQWDDEALPGNLLTEFSLGQLVITLEDTQSNQRYQSIVSIENGCIAQSLMNYFTTSEQIATHIQLFYDSQNQCALGLLLQKLPDNNTATDTEAWQRILLLANTLTQEEGFRWDTTTLLSKLFAEDQIRLFDATPVSFHCPCSSQKMLAAIITLGEQEVMSMTEDKRQLNVSCDYCNTKYDFDASEIKSYYTRH